MHLVDPEYSSILDRLGEPDVAYRANEVRHRSVCICGRTYWRTSFTKERVDRFPIGVYFCPVCSGWVFVRRTWDGTSEDDEGDAGGDEREDGSEGEEKWVDKIWGQWPRQPADEGEERGQEEDDDDDDDGDDDDDEGDGRVTLPSLP